MVGKTAVTLLAATFFLVSDPSQSQLGAAARIPQIGILIPESGPNEIQTLNGFREGLKELGYREGVSVQLAVRDTKGDGNALKSAASELLKTKIDLLLTTGTRATRAAMGATTMVPIIFRHPANPVDLGFVKDLDRPGTNVTGVAALSRQSTKKRLQILKEIMPNLRRVFLFYYINDRYSDMNLRAAEEAASALRLEVAERGVKSVDELKNSVRQLQTKVGDAIFHMPDDLVESQARFILDEAKKQRLVTMFNEEIWAAEGSLATFGPNYYQMGQQAAQLAHKILQGGKPKDLAVMRASKYDVVINLRTASIVGLNIPPEILNKADRVIR